MSLSADYCCENAGDRGGGGGGGGGALVHQRRMIRALFIWATLLTLGLAASITLPFIHKESQVQYSANNSYQLNTMNEDSKKPDLMTFKPSSGNGTGVELLQWNTVLASFIDGHEQLKMKYDGLYFLYLQVTLDQKSRGNYTITVQTNKEVILRRCINTPNLSTGLMGIGIALNSGNTFNVTCKPKAQIQNSQTETYMGVIKIG